MSAVGVAAVLRSLRDWVSGWQVGATPLLRLLPRTAATTKTASVASIGVLVVTLGLLAIHSKDYEVEHARVEIRDAAQSLSAHLLRVIEIANLLLRYQQDVAGLADRSADMVARANSRLQELAETVPYVFRLFITDEEGEVYATSMKQWPPLNARERDYFRFHQAGEQGLHISSVLRSQATGDPIIILSRRISGPSGDFRGVALVSFQLEMLGDLAQELLSLGRAADFQIIGPDMRVVSDGTPPPSVAGEFLSPAAQRLFKEASSGVWTYTEIDGLERIWAHERVGIYPLYVRVGVENRAVLAQWAWQTLPYAAFSLAVLLALASFAVMGIRHARALERAREELNEANRDLERRIAERTQELNDANQALRDSVTSLETINKVNRTLAAELDLETIVQAATDAATQITGAAFGAFFYNRVDSAGESYLLYSLSGVPREAFAGFPMPRNTKVFGPTFRGEGVVRSDDITRDPRYGKNAPFHGKPKGHLPVRSYLAAPVVSRSGEVLGGLFFGHPEPCKFSQRSEQLVSGIAAQAAIAIDNARLFEAAQSELVERRRAVEALQTSEARLQLTLEAGRLGTFERDLRTGIGEWSERARELHGRPPGDNRYTIDDLLALMDAEDRDSVQSSLKTSCSQRTPYEGEYRINLPGGTVRWIAARGEFLFDQVGEPQRAAGICYDITERKEAEQRLKLLAREVDHRAKNLLTVVHGMIRMTRAESVAGFTDAIEARIFALGQAHSLIAASRWTGADLRQLLEEGLEAHGSAEGEQILLSGPPVVLSPTAAQSISMAVHELATNATKYGALSRSEGRVAVDWSLTDDGQLRLCWAETGGPPVHPPTRAGFGTRVLQSVIKDQLRGEVHLKWAAEGLHCVFTLPPPVVLHRQVLVPSTYPD